jgi:hypothetical protein
MIAQDRSGDSADRAFAPPADPHTRWVDLGRVVYGWADRRDPAADKVRLRMSRSFCVGPRFSEEATA